MAVLIQSLFCLSCDIVVEQFCVNQTVDLPVSAVPGVSLSSSPQQLHLKEIIHNADWKRIIRKSLKVLFYSFISDISIAPLQVHYYSEVLPTTALIYCVGVNTPKHYRQLRVKVTKKIHYKPH